MIAIRTACATVFSLAALSAQADASFQYALSAENLETQTFNYLDVPSALFSTDGLKSVNAGGIAASVNAWADPSRGVFKAFSAVQVNGTQNINNASATASMVLTDTLRLTGPGSTARIDLTLNWDTSFAGLGFAAFSRVNQIEHHMTALSARDVALSYQIPNPIYDPNAVCIDYGSDGMFCPPETERFITKTERLDKTLVGQVALQRPNDEVERYGDDNGRYTGQQVLSVDLPTGVDITLNYSVVNSVDCFHLASCSLSSDASHSDYLGIKVAEGSSFSSAEGYQYLGLAAAVPEPSTLMLGLAGLLGLALRVRRKA